MMAVDTNILVYAHRQDSPWNPQAAACLISLAEAASPWAIWLDAAPQRAQ